MNQTRVNQVFERVLAMSPDERAAMIERECGDDQELRRAVTALLGALDRAGGFMASPTADHTVRVPERNRGPALVGSCIGPYRLLELIGEGGFGAVYMAEQSAPIRRRVAVKVLKPGMDSRSVVGRFEAERQAVALMDHPNIAKVFDAGTTAPELGQLPYFVMELVRGVPITQYCDEVRLTPRERLEILVPVCLAVQHAHSKGVIHRDIKPGNVLVTLHDGKPVPKVIDFGIAKATGAALTEKTVFTEFRALIGTPAYMSPEQAEMSGLDIDTRSDIYSLGVLMYELLTGSAPFDGADLARAGLAEMQRIIREHEPPRPSTRISTAGEGLRVIADQRHSSPDRLARFVRGELDWIVMRALEKDRSRRYSTADAFAADISRFLAGEPVHAAPPSNLYRVQKFAKRHRGPVIAGAAVCVSALAGLAGTSLGFLDAKAGRMQAEKAVERATGALNEAQHARELERTSAAVAIAQARRARAAADLMRWGLSHQAQRPSDSPPLSAGELLSMMAERVDKEPWTSPAEETYPRAALADLLLAAGEFHAAQRQTDCLRILWEREGPPDAETAMVTAWTAVEVERATACSNGERYWGPLLREQTLIACARVSPALRDAFDRVMHPALLSESVTVDEYQRRSATFKETLRSTHPPDEVATGMVLTLHACWWGRWQMSYGWPHTDAFLGAIEDLIAAIPVRSGLRERLLLVECDVLHLRLARRDPVPWEQVVALADSVDRLGEGAWLRGPLDCHVGKAMVASVGKDPSERLKQGLDRAARGFARIRGSPVPHQALLQSSIGALFDTVQLTGDPTLVDRALGRVDESIRDALIDLSPPDVFDDPPRVARLYRRLAAALDAHPLPDAGTRRIVASILSMSLRQVIQSGGGGTWREVDEAAVLIAAKADQLFRDSGDPDWMVTAWLNLRGSIIAAAGPDREQTRRFAERGAALGERTQGPRSPMAIVCRGSEGLWCMHHGLLDDGTRILRRYLDESIALGPPDNEVWEHATPFLVYLARTERWDDLAAELSRVLPWFADARGRVPTTQLRRVAQVSLFQPNPSVQVCEQVLAVADRCRSIDPGDPSAPLLKGLAFAWLGRADEALSSLDEADHFLANKPPVPGDYRPGMLQAGRAVAFTCRGDLAGAQEALAAMERTDFEKTKRGFVELWHFRARVRQRVTEASLPRR